MLYKWGIHTIKSGLRAGGYTIKINSWGRRHLSPQFDSSHRLNSLSQCTQCIVVVIRRLRCKANMWSRINCWAFNVKEQLSLQAERGLLLWRGQLPPVKRVTDHPDQLQRRPLQLLVGAAPVDLHAYCSTFSTYFLFIYLLSGVHWYRYQYEVSVLSTLLALLKYVPMQGPTKHVHRMSELWLRL